MTDMSVQVLYIMTLASLVILAIVTNKRLAQSNRESKQLREKNGLLEMVLDNIETTVYAKDTQGRFLYVNNEWMQMTGHKKEDVIGKTDYELCGEELGQSFWHADSQVIESMKRIETEEVVAVEDYQKTILSIKVPMMLDSVMRGVCGIGTDITQMKALQMNLTEEKEKSEQLLLNVLPKSVAEELKTYGTTKTESFERVGVLFSDICDFTRISSGLPPEILINELNDIFTHFDYIIEEKNCERIKTIGDAYMAVCGIHQDEVCDVNFIVDSAIGFINALNDRSLKSEIRWQTRIGIHAGPVVGGVVGVKKYIYDIFGSTVNMASRLQAATKIYDVDILISDSIYTHIANHSAYCIREIDKVRVKGEYQPITLYEVFDGDAEELKKQKVDSLATFNEGRKYYIEGNFDAAMTLFKKCKEMAPKDKLPSIYIKRCATMKRLPANENWEGISGI